MGKKLFWLAVIGIAVVALGGLVNTFLPTQFHFFTNLGSAVIGFIAAGFLKLWK